MTARSKTILCIVGARPNFIKIAPIMRAIAETDGRLVGRLVHTGQHYDADMKASFFDQLGIPEPDVDLEVGSGSHAEQTAQVMIRFEPVLDREDPDAVLVVGDVNSTIACALVAAKRQVPVIHVEAGLRSGDRAMPEEINRVLTDQISDILFTTEPDARENLLREGVKEERIHFVGNVMIDTLHFNLSRAVDAASTMERYGYEVLPPRSYAVLTLHRPSNVDDATVLQLLLDELIALSRFCPIFFPMHPRTRSRVDALDYMGRLKDSRVCVLPPLGYLEMLGLNRHAKLVMTDSGGLQEETTALEVPCLTIRNNTERYITVTEGSNRIVGNDPANLASAFRQVLDNEDRATRVPALWDGNAATRICAEIERWLESGVA